MHVPSGASAAAALHARADGFRAGSDTSSINGEKPHPGRIWSSCDSMAESMAGEVGSLMLANAETEGG